MDDEVIDNFIEKLKEDPKFFEKIISKSKIKRINKEIFYEYMLEHINEDDKSSFQLFLLKKAPVDPKTVTLAMKRIHSGTNFVLI